MATPQETRDRIKEMRQRIFEGPDEEPVKINIQETSSEDESVGKKSIGVSEHYGSSSNKNIKETIQKNSNSEKKANAGQEQENSLNAAKTTNSIEESFSEKLQQNDNRISLLCSDTQKHFSEIALEFANNIRSLETAILDKLKDTLEESNSKINGVEQLVNDSNISSAQADEAIKEELSQLNHSLQLDISSLANRFSTENQKIETEIKDNADKLSIFKNSVEERQHSIEESFSEKLQQNEDRISLLSADTQKHLSETTLEFANKNKILETVLVDKYEHISFHLAKVEEQVENQLNNLSSSLQKFILSITTSQEEKIDAINQKVNLLQQKLQSDVTEIKALVLEQKPLLENSISTYALASNKKIDVQAQKFQESVKLLKQEIFEYQRDIKTDFNKNIKKNELKTNEHLSKKIFEVRELLLEEMKSLSEDLTITDVSIKEKHLELATLIDNNVSDIKHVVEKDRKYFIDQFEKVSDSIQSVESMIVREEDLTELFQNYTLNVNISDNS